jgi:hypothetical protein
LIKRSPDQFSQGIVAGVCYPLDVLDHRSDLPVSQCPLIIQAVAAFSSSWACRGKDIASQSALST